MKKLVSLLLACSVLASVLSGCKSADDRETSAQEVTTLDTGVDISAVDLSLDDCGNTDVLRYVEDALYTDLVSEIDNDKYFIENIQAVYVSQEYIEELTSNSQSTIYFGYTLEDIEKEFQDTKFVFTLGEDNTTVVKPFEKYDDTYEQVIRNVAIGSGVILVCVVISTVTGGAGATAASAIFAASAKSGAIGALTGGLFSGTTAGIMKGIETGDMDEALKAAALSGSEGFKWGAITGSVSGAASETIALKGMTLGGRFTMNQAAEMQKAGYPLDVIKQFQTYEQFEICQKANLTPCMVNNKLSLVRNIDLDYVDDLGRTNLQRMQKGLAAIDPTTGESFQLHHIGQKMDSTLAILSEAEHMQGGNNAIWHVIGKTSEIDRNVFDAERAQYWISLAKMLAGG